MIRLVFDTAYANCTTEKQGIEMYGLGEFRIAVGKIRMGQPEKLVGYTLYRLFSPQSLYVSQQKAANVSLVAEDLPTSYTNFWFGVSYMALPGAIRHIYAYSLQEISMDYTIEDAESFHRSYPLCAQGLVPPPRFSGVEEHNDLLMFLVFEMVNEYRVIVEWMDMPANYQLWFDDKAKWDYINTAINEDNGEKLYQAHRIA